MNRQWERQWQQTRTSGYTERVQIGSAERPTPGSALRHGDCTESLDVANVQLCMVHQLHLHADATVRTRNFCLLGHDCNRLGLHRIRS